MTRALLIALYLSAIMVSVSATDVPSTPSLLKRKSMSRIPRGLLEEKADSIELSAVHPCSDTKPCKTGTCWYVALILITGYCSLSSTYLGF
jgi:hypothetical protein